MWMSEGKTARRLKEWKHILPEESAQEIDLQRIWPLMVLAWLCVGNGFGSFRGRVSESMLFREI